jgi:hypothetical protein
VTKLRLGGAARIAAVTTLAVTGTIATATGAGAASGTFTYHDANGKTHTISGPSYGHCYSAAGDGTAQNHTNAMAMLFPTGNCRGRYVPLNRGEAKTVHFTSAMFLA